MDNLANLLPFFDGGLDMNVILNAAMELAEPPHLEPNVPDEHVRNENYFELTMPNYSLDEYQSHFRMNRVTMEVEIYKTGGGGFVPPTTDESDEKLLAAMKPQFCPLANQFDDDVGFHPEVVYDIRINDSQKKTHAEELEYEVVEQVIVDDEQHVETVEPGQPCQGSSQSTCTTPRKKNLKEEFYKWRVECLNAEHEFKMKCMRIEHELKMDILKKENQIKDMELQEILRNS